MVINLPIRITFRVQIVPDDIIQNGAVNYNFQWFVEHGSFHIYGGGDIYSSNYITKITKASPANPIQIYHDFFLRKKSQLSGAMIYEVLTYHDDVTDLFEH